MSGRLAGVCSGIGVEGRESEDTGPFIVHRGGEAKSPLRLGVRWLASHASADLRRGMESDRLTTCVQSRVKVEGGNTLLESRGSSI